MKLLKTIHEGDTMLDLLDNVISNIKFYIMHREELNDIKLSNEYLCVYIAKIEEIKDRYFTPKVPTWFKEYNAYSLLSGDFPYINSYLGFTFSLYDLINMVLCEEMTFKFEDGTTSIIDTTKLLDSQHVMIYFKDRASIILDKDDWDKYSKFFI